MRVEELVCSNKLIQKGLRTQTRKLRHPRLGRIDFNQLRILVENDKKGRFRLMQTKEGDATATWWIRANQGHSFMVGGCHFSLASRAINIEYVSRSILWTFSP